MQIEMQPIVSEQEPLLVRKEKIRTRDSTFAGLALLAVIGLGIFAFVRGDAHKIALAIQQKYSVIPLCDGLASEGYGEKAQKDCIAQLPGLAFKPRFRSFSGYLKVPSGPKHELFYWFVEAQKNPEKAPLVFWMNGGPGCSGLDGLLSEHGPYLIHSDLSLRENPVSLNHLANVVYFEAPLGVGFSAVPKGEKPITGDMPTARDNAAMIREFLRLYIKYTKHEVYIMSESYGGHYMPTLAEEILRGIDELLQPIVNFKGLAVGNPFVDFWGNMRGSVNAYLGHGLVKLPVQDQWNQQCDRTVADWKFCGHLYNEISSAVGHLDPYALDFTFCPTDSLENGGKHSNSARLQAELMRKAIAKILKIEHKSGYVACADNYMEKYLNQPNVQNALHAKPVRWSLCSDPVHKQWPSASWEYPMQQVYQRLAASNRIKMMVYSGDDDSVCSTYSTQLWMWSLGFPASKNLDWRPWYLKDQLAGYQTRFMSEDGSRTAMDFTTIHSAGHMVPQTQPERAFEMYRGFLDSDPTQGFRLGQTYE